VTQYSAFQSGTGNNTAGPASSTSYGGVFTAGMAFEVTSSGQYLYGYYVWRADSSQSASVQCALWLITAAATGTYQGAGTLVSSSSLVAGQWNYLPLATPFALTVSTPYKAVYGLTGNFSETHTEFGTGGPFLGGIVNGPLTVYSSPTGQGGTNQVPFVNSYQGTFGTAGSDPTANYPTSDDSQANFWVDILVGPAAVSAVAFPAAPVPPGYRSPAAWKQFPYPRLGQTVTIAGSGSVAVPKPSLSGSGVLGGAVTLPASPLMPPGAASPAAWQHPRYPRLGAVTTIAGSGGVAVPKPSLAGTGNVTLQVTLPASPLMPPGARSPAAWQFPAYRRLGQTVTIAGSGGVTVPKPVLAGSGNVTLTVALPAAAPMPPGAVSPAAWQFPRYPRLGQVTTIAGSGGVVLPKPSLAGTGNVTYYVALPAVAPLPPGALSPAAWQFPRYPRLLATTTIAGSGSVAVPKPALTGLGTAGSIPSVLPAAQPLPPGLTSPAAWQFPRYPRLGQVTTVAGSGGVIVPKPSLAGTGTEGSIPFTLPATQPLPPGAVSPAAWQHPRYPRLGAVTTVAGSGGVAVPKPSLSGLATEGAIPFTLPASPLMPPGALSPAAWQRPRYPRLGQVTTIAGSGSVAVPKPSLAGQGAVSPPAVFPAVQVMPPGARSPAAWQFPRYPRLGQVTTVAGSGSVAVPKPVLAGTGLVASAAVYQAPLMPPGALSPAAWQRPRYQRAGQVTTIAGSGGVAVPKPALAGTGTVTVPQAVTLPAAPLIPPGYRSPMAFQRAIRQYVTQILVIAQPGTVTITDGYECTVTITDQLAGAVTITDIISGTVTITDST
jgi:hypothetical protein